MTDGRWLYIVCISFSIWLQVMFTNSYLRQIVKALEKNENS